MGCTAAVGSSFIDESKRACAASELSLAELNRCTLIVPSPLLSLVDASGVVTPVIMACLAPRGSGALATPT
jgi:hypothetical protein